MILQVEISPAGPQCLYCSPSTYDLLGWTPAEFKQVPFTEVYPKESREVIQHDIHKLLTGADSSMVSMEVCRKDGTRIWTENKVRLLTQPKDGKFQVLVVKRDITERRQLQQQLARLALHDGLTGIPNRRCFDEQIASAWSRALLLNEPLSLVLIDIDCFKLLNDTYGHQAGDDCLRAVAGLVHSIGTAGGGTAARFGGEEFGILLPATSLDHSQQLAERLCREVAALHIPNVENHAGNGCLSISCGVSTAMPPTMAAGAPRMPDGLISTTDRALYQAKRSGRNRVCTSFLLTATDNLGTVAALA